MRCFQELHPDKNLRVDKFDRELIHDQYVKVVEAYSVLGKEKERQMYDIKTGIKTDPEQFQTSRTGDNNQRQGWRPMSFEERVKAYGFPEQVTIVISVHDPVTNILPQDPDFYKKRGNYHHKVVIACIVWIIFGMGSKIKLLQMRMIFSRVLHIFHYHQSILWNAHKRVGASKSDK